MSLIAIMLPALKKELRLEQAKYFPSSPINLSTLFFMHFRFCVLFHLLNIIGQKIAGKPHKDWYDAVHMSVQVILPIDSSSQFSGYTLLSKQKNLNLMLVSVSMSNL